MATLGERDRDKLRSSQFAYVDRKGGEHLPIHGEAQAFPPPTSVVRHVDVA